MRSIDFSRRGDSRHFLLDKLQRLTAYAVVCVWLALLAGLAGRWAWVLDLFAHFRPQYALAFIVLTVLTLSLRQWLLAVAAVVGIGVSSVPLFSYIAFKSPLAALAQTTTPTFRLVSFNVWFRNPDMARTAAYLEQSRADAIVLLELTSQQAEALLPLLPSYPYHHIDAARMGAAVFSKWPVSSAASVPLARNGAIAAHLRVDWRGTPTSVLGVHLNWPMGPRNAEFRNEELQALVQFAKTQSEPLIIGGDFNLTPWSQYFSDALSQAGLHDAAVGFGLKPSWPARFPLAGIRIDHCWLSTHWRSVAVSVGPALDSDHLPVVADLELIAPPPAGPAG